MGSTRSSTWQLECVGKLERVLCQGLGWSEEQIKNLYKPSPQEGREVVPG